MPGPEVSRGLALMGHCLGGVKTPPYGLSFTGAL